MYRPTFLLLLLRGTNSIVLIRLCHRSFLYIEYLRDAVRLNILIREELDDSKPRLQDVVLILQDDVALETACSNGPTQLELETRALQMLSPTRPPNKHLLDGILNAVANLPAALLKRMVQCTYEVPAWFFAKTLPQFLRLSCKYSCLQYRYLCSLLAALPLFLASSPTHADLMIFVTLADAQQFVALEGLVLPRLPADHAAEDDDGAAHVLAPVVATQEHYRDRVLVIAGFRTVLEMGFQAFCDAPGLSIPVRYWSSFYTTYRQSIRTRFISFFFF